MTYRNELSIQEDSVFEDQDGVRGGGGDLFWEVLIGDPTWISNNLWALALNFALKPKSLSSPRVQYPRSTRSSIRG